MKNIAIIALVFVLSCASLTGCRSGNTDTTDMTTMPSVQPTESTGNDGPMPGNGSEQFGGQNAQRRIHPPKGR